MISLKSRRAGQSSHQTTPPDDHRTCPQSDQARMSPHKPSTALVANDTSQQTTTAHHRALDVAELLELMLIGVDMRTLLVSQRVSKYWHTLISNSPTLQKKLFLAPATSRELLTLSIAPPPSTDADHLQRPTMVHVKTSLASEVPSTEDLAVLNPLMFWHGSPQSRKGAWTCGSKSLGRPQQAAVKPSWQKMLVTQPPIVEVSAGDRASRTECVPGVTLGESFDIADTLHSTHAQSTYPLPEVYVKSLGTCVTSEPFWLAVEKEMTLYVVDLEEIEDSSSEEDD